MSLWYAVGALIIALVLSLHRAGWLFIPTDPNPTDWEFGTDWDIWYACPACGEEVQSLPPDGIDYCGDCERICEGDTIEMFGDSDAN